MAAESHQGRLFCCGGKGNDRKERDADIYRGSIERIKLQQLPARHFLFFGAKRKEVPNRVKPTATAPLSTIGKMFGLGINPYQFTDKIYNRYSYFVTSRMQSE